MPDDKQGAATASTDEEASFRLLDEWLQIETDHTNRGFNRSAVIAWCESRPLTAVLAAAVAVAAGVIAALHFG